MKKAYVFLAEGFEECEALIVVDILRRAGFDCRTLSISDAAMVESSHKVKVLADGLASDEDLSSADIVILPGGIPGTYNLAESNLVKKACTDYSKGKYVAAICAAPSILSSLGITDGKNATCAPAFEEKMGNAALTHSSVAVDGNIITGQGLGAAIPFALKIVEMLESKDLSDKIAAKICYKTL